MNNPIILHIKSRDPAMYVSGCTNGTWVKTNVNRDGEEYEYQFVVDPTHPTVDGILMRRVYNNIAQAHSDLEEMRPAGGFQ